MMLQFFLGPTSVILRLVVQPKELGGDGGKCLKPGRERLRMHLDDA